MQDVKTRAAVLVLIPLKSGRSRDRKLLKSQKNQTVAGGFMDFSLHGQTCVLVRGALERVRWRRILEQMGWRKIKRGAGRVGYERLFHNFPHQRHAMRAGSVHMALTHMDRR